MPRSDSGRILPQQGRGARACRRDFGRHARRLSGVSAHASEAEQPEWRSTRHLRKHCRPLHGLRLDKIDRRAVAARITTLAANSGAVASNRVAASLSAFFNWAIREGLASHNPAGGLNRQPERSRKRVLNDSELKAIWAATADASDYSAVVRLLM